MAEISVIIPVYNAETTLPDTIASLRAQTLTNWEAILIEDGSSDTSWQVAQTLVRQDHRLRLVRNPGKGPSAARNHGALHLAQGPILAFCDADDMWMPDKLSQIRAAMRAGSDAAFGRICFFRDDPNLVRTRSSLPKGPVDLSMLIGENPVCTVSNLSLHRSVFKRLRGFREDMVHNEDLEFLIRLVGHGYQLTGIDADHVLYRLSPLGLSADLEAMRAGRREALRSAGAFGQGPDPRAEAVHLRYLARRALRIGAPVRLVRDLVLEGCREDAPAFLLPARRGVLIALAAVILPLMPNALRQHLFSN